MTTTIDINKTIENIKFCLDQNAYEDAIGYTLDILEFIRPKMDNDRGMIYKDILSMVRHYGKEYI